MPILSKPLFLSLVFALLVFMPGCETNDSSVQAEGASAAASSGGTLADKEVNLGGIEKNIPFPAEGTIGVTHEGDGFTSILFRPEITFREAVAFFDEGFSRHGWSITDSYRSEPDEDGEVTVEWNLRGHDKELKVDLTAFGGWNASNPRGTILVR